MSYVHMREQFFKTDPQSVDLTAPFYLRVLLASVYLSECLHICMEPLGKFLL